MSFSTFSQCHSSRIAAAAIHDGHRIRTELQEHLALDDSQRLREEDPHTGRWAGLFDNHVIAHHSRFEVDLNRPPESAVYRKPSDAWGLEVWQTPLSNRLITRSREFHREFYNKMEAWLRELVAGGPVLLLDIHSYNHRRQGPGIREAEEANPVINIGTGTMPDQRWRPVIDCFCATMAGSTGQSLDVRENVKFRGGYFPKWVNSRFFDQICVLSIEFKKVFMDEWTGNVDWSVFDLLSQALTESAERASRRQQEGV